MPKRKICGHAKAEPKHVTSLDLYRGESDIALQGQKSNTNALSIWDSVIPSSRDQGVL